MKYTVHWNTFRDVNSDGHAVGVEIQPPVLDPKGIISRLVRVDGSSRTAHQFAHVAEEATVTRNDQEGTALIISLNENRPSLDVPRTIGRLLDPCGIHEIAYVPPLDGATLERP